MINSGINEVYETVAFQLLVGIYTCIYATN